MTKEQYQSISKWQNIVFTKATPLSCVNHLEEEVKELKAELESGNIDHKEIADCFLLLIGVCNKAGLSYDEIVNAIDAKMEVNYKREWGQPNDKGYVKHIQ